MRTLLFVAAALLAASLSAQSSTETTPTTNEQLFLYEVNRARSNPQGYDAEKGLGGVCNGITPARPLALNKRLVTSSRFHTDEMAQYGYFAHTSAVTGNQPNKMVRNAGYPLAAYLPDAANNLESLAGQAGSSGVSYDPVAAVKALIQDSGVNPPGHRYHLLAWGGSQSTIDFNRSFREAGAGYASGKGWSSYAGGAYWAFHTGMRDQTNMAWITGVIYDDLNNNGKCDAGEGLSGVTVELTNWNTQSVQGSYTTGAGGGYVFQVNNGVFVLKVSGGAFSGTRWAKVTVANYANMQVDFRSNSMNADINFGTFGALADSDSVDGSSEPAPPPTSSGGGGSGGGGGGGGSAVPVNPGQAVDWGDSQGCVAGTRGETWLPLLLLLAVLATGLTLRRKRA